MGHKVSTSYGGHSFVTLHVFSDVGIVLKDTEEVACIRVEHKRTVSKPGGMSKPEGNCELRHNLYFSILCAEKVLC